MTVTGFISKWRKVELKERSVAQEHFLDLCDLFDHVNRERWWIFERPRPELRAATAALTRFIATPQVSKHRLFVWVDPVYLCDVTTLCFARADDSFFGVLQSRFHEVWALKLGTRLETRPRYTPTTCFETFPFPDAHPEHDAMIATAAKELNERRETWLNPPEWTRTETLVFPGTVGGPWDRYIDPATAEDRGAFKVGTVRYPRLVPRDADCAARLKDRTLTKLYNARPAWLADCHARLDAAVLMIDYNVGVSTIATYELKKIDTDYFTEE